MTASQRLAALEARTRTDHRLNYDRVAALSEVEAVLPEIVAVVRAAEADLDHLSRQWRGESFVVPETTHALRAALAALVAKLGDEG